MLRAASLVGRRRTQPDDLVLDLKFSLLEAAHDIVVGVRPFHFLRYRVLKGSVLCLQRFDVVHSAHETSELDGGRQTLTLTWG